VHIIVPRDINGECEKREGEVVMAGARKGKKM
jgi:hypothetical protein